MQNYSLKYKRFDQLLDEVMLDFPNYSLENLIEPHNMIKIAKKCNYDLGLKINMTKEVVLDVEKGRARLPYDFFTFNYGLLCGNYTQTVIPPQGVQTFEEPYPRYKEFNPIIDVCKGDGLCPSCAKPVTTNCGCAVPTPVQTDQIDIPPYNPLVPYGDYCVKPRVFMNCKGESFELVQIVNTQIRTFRYLMPVRLRNDSQDYDCNCPNIHVKSKEEIWIKDGWVYTNFDHGKLYVNYQGLLVDKENNVLVLDHDVINEFYEYALKERILENLWINGEDVERKYIAMKANLKEARKNAMSIANMPNFSDLKSTWETNRKAMYNKYYLMFRSFQDDIWMYWTTYNTVR